MQSKNLIPKLEKKVILYIDILGAKDKMENEAEKTLTTFYNLLHNVSNLQNNLQNLQYNDNHCIMFSDNLVITFCKHIKKTNEPITIFDIVDAFSFACFFQTQAIKAGLLLRGGIVIGDIYIDDVFVYGTGLINAYYIENNAKYPRIVIDKSIIDYISNDKTNALNMPKGAICYTMDDDRKFFLDYLSAMGMNEEDRDEIIKCGNSIIDNIKESELDASISEKYAWQRKYFERYKRENV